MATWDEVVSRITGSLRANIDVYGDSPTMYRVKCYIWDESTHQKTQYEPFPRGAKMDEEIDQNFMEVLEEEGYRVEEVTKHARRNK